MGTESPLGVLRSLGLLSWETVAVGWDRGWITESSVGDYATECLMSDLAESELMLVAALTSAEGLSASEISQQLAQLAKMKSDDEERSLNAWRLARLIELASKDLDWEVKVTRLEELCAEFGYPSDMRLCSRYVTVGERLRTDPLDAMIVVIDELKRRLGIA